VRYTLYIDESGDHTYKNLDDPSCCHLALTGVVIESDYYRTVLHKLFEDLKQTNFPHNPDEPLIVHRDDIIKRKWEFKVLNDPSKNALWESSLIDFIRTAQFQIITIVIDKKNHISYYGVKAHHPYHRCMELMLERYRGFLHSTCGLGDVMVESRGGTEDMLLKRKYRSIYNNGTAWIPEEEFKKALTSKELKVKPKEKNITGLQIADLLAHESKINILISHGKISRPSSLFINQLLNVIDDKYNRYGKVLI
jgi:hypothetical protein